MAARLPRQDIAQERRERELADGSDEYYNYVCRILREVQRPRDSHTKYCANFNNFSHCAPPTLMSRNFARKPTPLKFRKTFREILGYGSS